MGKKIDRKTKKTIEKEKKYRKKKLEEEKEDAKLLALIKAKLKKDPIFYIDFLKGIIDETAGEIWDDEEKKNNDFSYNDLFEALKPTFTKKPTLDEILSGRKISYAHDDSLIVSPESVDMLFYPAVRKRLKEWQQTFFDAKSSDSQKLKAEENLQRVFSRLTYKGQGTPKKITPDIKRKIRNKFNIIDETCKKIFQKSKRSEENRKMLIKEKFPLVVEEIIKNMSSINTYEKLRNLVLSKICGCSVRAVEECIREFNLIKIYKLFSDKNVNSITVRGIGNKAIITSDKRKKSS